MMGDPVSKMVADLNADMENPANDNDDENTCICGQDRRQQIISMKKSLRNVQVIQSWWARLAHYLKLKYIDQDAFSGYNMCKGMCYEIYGTEGLHVVPGKKSIFGDNAKDRAMRAAMCTTKAANMLVNGFRRT